MSNKKTTLKLPRLRTKEELLKTSPELFNKLLGDDLGTARSTSPNQGKSTTTSSSGNAGRLHSGGPSHTTQRTLPKAAGATTTGTMNYDTPRGFGEGEGLSEEQELGMELESVKRERMSLLESIAHVKAEAGTAGGEAQQTEIRQLLKELELKKAKLNELKGDSRRHEGTLAKLRDDNTDAQRLTPDGCVEEMSYIASLKEEMSKIEEELQEAEAKNRLYFLLGERTRREHMAIDQKVRTKQDSKSNCLDDFTSLSEHYNTTRAAKEVAEKELAKVRRQVEEARQDWQKKIRERRREVRELKRRQQRDREKELRRRESSIEKEKAEREASARLKMEKDAYELQVAALAPKIQAMEASWNRLRAITGADTPDGVIDYWTGLKAKEHRMHDLVALAERREAACKEEIARLLTTRSEMFEATAAAGRDSAVLPAGAAAADGEHEVAVGEGGEASRRIEEAEKRIDTAQTQFNKLRTVCIGAEQGLKSLLERLAVTLDEATSPVTSPVKSPDTQHHTNRPTSHSMSDGRKSRERLGTAGSAGSNSRVTRTPSMSHGISHDGHLSSRNRNRTSARDARSNNGVLATDPIAEDTHSAADAISTRRASGARNTIDDDDFFSDLPATLFTLAEKLAKVHEKGMHLDLELLQQRAAAVEAAALAANTSSQAQDNMDSASVAESASPPTTARGEVLDGAAAFAAAASAAVEPEAVAAPDATAEDDVMNSTEGAVAAAADAGEGAAAEEGNGSDVGEHADGDADADANADADADAAHASDHEGDEEAAEGEPGTDAAGADETDGATADGQTEGQDMADGEEPAAAAAAEGSAAGLGGESAEAPDGPAADAGVDGSAESRTASRPASGAPGNGSARGPAPAAPAPAPVSTNSQSAAEPEQQQEQEQQEEVYQAREESSSLLSSLSPTHHARTHSAVPDVPTIPEAAIHVGDPTSGAICPSEKRLMKDLYRRSWTGAPWLDTVGNGPSAMAASHTLLPSMKRKKGKKKDSAPAMDLTRVLGYAPDIDFDVESDEDHGDVNGEEVAPGEGVVDREYLKMRAAKMTARHNAKQQQAQAGGGR